MKYLRIIGFAILLSSNLSADRVLVLGATGHIANLVVEQLDKNHPEIKLRLASSRPEGVASLKRKYPNAEVVLANWYNVNTLSKAFSGVDRILFIPPDGTDETKATPNVIAAVKHPTQIVRLIVHAPDMTLEKISPRLKEINIGEAMHLTAKEQLDKSNIPVTYINIPAWIMFSYPSFFSQQIKAKRQVQMPYDRYWTWIDEQDIAEVFAKVLSDPIYSGKELTLTGSTKYLYSDTAPVISAVIGQNVTYSSSEQGIRNLFGNYADTILEYFAHEQTDYSMIEPNDTIQKVLGRRPKTLSEYLTEHANDYL